MRKNSARKVRQSWMRKFRRAKEGRGYVLQRTSPVTAKIGDAPVIYPGKLYILKSDGRSVIEITDEKTKKVSYQVVNIGVENSRVQRVIDGKLVSVV